MSIPDDPDVLSVALRAVSFALLLNAAGIPIFIAAFGRLMPSAVPAVRQLGWRLAIGALVFVVGQHALEAARMTGEMSGVMNPAMQKMALLSPMGAAFAARVLGLVLVAVGLRRAAPLPQRQGAALARTAAASADASDVLARTAATSAGVGGALARTAATSAGVGGALARTAAASAGVGAAGASQLTGARGPLVIALVGAFISTTAFTLVGHTSVSPHRFAAVGLLTLHLLVVAFWLGALWPLYLAAKKEQSEVTARVIDAFSMAAAWVVPLILLAGIGLTAILVPSIAVFRQPYGQLLLAKVSLFAVLMAMATLNKWRFGPACAKGNTAAFERTVVIEYVLICVVLAVSAVLTTFYSPEVA